MNNTFSKTFYLQPNTAGRYTFYRSVGDDIPICTESVKTIIGSTPNKIEITVSKTKKAGWNKVRYQDESKDSYIRVKNRWFVSLYQIAEFLSSKGIQQTDAFWIKIEEVV